MPEVAGALAIRDGDPVTRRAVEGRLLAGLACEAIAAELRLAVGAIDRYERLFFNVADRLGNAGYIVHRAIGAWGARPGPPNPDSLSRSFGYFGGPIALAALESSPTYAALCAGRAPGPLIFAGQGADLVGLAIMALGLDVDPGTRKGPMLLLRLAESERVYGSKGVVGSLLTHTAQTGLFDRVDQLSTVVNAHGAAGSGEGIEPGHVVAYESSTSTDGDDDRRDGAGSMDQGLIDSQSALSRVA